MSEFNPGGLSFRIGNQADFQDEDSLALGPNNQDVEANSVHWEQNYEDKEETLHMAKEPIIRENDTFESAEQILQDIKEKPKNFEKFLKLGELQKKDHEMKQKLKEAEENKFGKIESVDRLMTLHFNPFSIEREFIDINNFADKDIEKRALNLDIIDASEDLKNYKYNRTQNQTTRGFWNKWKEGVDARLEQEEDRKNEKEDAQVDIPEDNDSDDEEEGEEIIIKEIISQVENMKV